MPKCRSTLAYLLISVALIVCTPTAYAQTDASETARFQLADTYLRAGQFDRAIGLLEDLYEGNKEYSFFTKLRQAYESTKRYDEAIALIDERLKQNENPSVLYSEKARLLYLKDDREAAFETWDAAIAVAPDQSANYRLVYQSLSQAREFEKAIELLLRARTALDDESLFRRDLGNLYGLTGEHRSAMEEYVRLVEDDPRQVTTVKSHLARVSDSPNVVKESVEVVEEAVQRTPLNRPLRELLGWLYLESELFRPAFDTYRAIDRLEKEEGRVLFSFANQAAAASAFDVSLEAYEEILERYGSLAIAPEALRGKAEVHTRWAENLSEKAVESDGSRSDAPHYSKALEAYTTFVDQFGVSANIPYVLLDLGRLQQNIFRQYEEAATHYSSILNRFPTHAAAEAASLESGRLLVLQGNLEEARLVFARLSDNLRTGDLAEQARYEISLVHVYRGEFDAADALVGALKENTSNNTANDAIALRVLLMENVGPDSLAAPLTMFAEAALLKRQFHYVRAFDKLEELLNEHGSHPLADEALHEQALLLLELSRFEESFQLFAELPLRHPESFLADRSLFKAAEIQAENLENPDRAIELYSRLLTDYPGSLLTATARERIRVLRGDNV